MVCWALFSRLADRKARKCWYILKNDVDFLILNADVLLCLLLAYIKALSHVQLLVTDWSSRGFQMMYKYLVIIEGCRHNLYIWWNGDVTELSLLRGTYIQINNYVWIACCSFLCLAFPPKNGFLRIELDDNTGNTKHERDSTGLDQGSTDSVFVSYRCYSDMFPGSSQ